MLYFHTMLKSKLPQLPPSIFATMTQLANKHEALNMSQGFPSFKSDKILKDLLKKAVDQNHNQYAPMKGIAALRNTISIITEKAHKGFYDPETEICLTAGATQAIYTAIQTVINKDDEVIILTPAYDCYAPAIQLAGGKVVAVPMNLPDFSVDWDRVNKSVNDKTKLIIINFPHNPSGSLMDEGDWESLQEIVLENELYLLSDEVYEYMVFDDRTHFSAARFAQLKERTFITCSFGKTFHVTGWKLGYCLAPKNLMDEFLKIHQNVVFCVSHPAQIAVNEYLLQPLHYLELSAFYQRKRDLFLSLIKESKFKFVPTQSTYFQLLDYSDITDEGDVAFAKRLTMEHKIASIPISVFMDGNDHKMLRFCFAKEDHEIIEAARILSLL
jgi:methionine aminotransferase